MKEEGLRSITVKKYKHHTSKIAIEAPAPNILNRNFKSNKRGEKIVGWAFGKKMTTELVFKALEMTVKNVDIRRLYLI